VANNLQIVASFGPKSDCVVISDTISGHISRVCVEDMLARVVGRYQKYVDVLRQGWHEVPHLYGTTCIGIAATFALIYRIAHTPPGGHITRFKERYMVMRPEDDRLIAYPRDYVTDKDLLK